MPDTLTELTARVRSFIPDSDGEYVADADIAKWVNEAYFDLADRMDVVSEEFTGTTSGATLTLPPSGSAVVKRVSSLRLDDSDVAFVDDVTFNGYVDATADPGFVLAREYDGTVEMFPTPDTGTDYVLRCYIVPGPLSAGNEHELPIWAERKMVDFAVYRSFQKMGELGRGDSFLATYEQGLPSPSMGRDLEIPGPLTLNAIVGPFDLDVDAKHI